MYAVRTPTLIQCLFPRFLWRISRPEKALYLTFDDGPIPQVTPWVLEQLRTYGAKATFFCVGDNVRKHPTLFRQLQEEGHAVGNHTMHHRDGWKCPTDVYLRDVEDCQHLVGARLFRPPYGHLCPAQKNALQKSFRIVLWDVLSGDFDDRLSPDACLDNVLQHARPGSVVVFHDSLKARIRLETALPGVLRHFNALGYAFKALEPTHEIG